MRVIRVRRRLDSETLQLPEVRDLIGKEVEIVIIEGAPAPVQKATGAHDYSALAEIAGRDLIAPEVYKELRAASRS